MLAVLVALAWRPIKNALGSPIDNLSPVEILRKRYAEGGLSEVGYQGMMENLSREQVNSA